MMELSCKIIALPAEKVSIKRRVPPLPLGNVDTLADFSHVFGNLPTLNDKQAWLAARELCAKFNFGLESTLTDIENLFTRPKFCTLVTNDKKTQQALAYFIQELVAKDKIPTAKRLVGRLLEYSSKDMELAKSLLFLKARLESDQNTLFGTYQNISQNNQHPIVWPLCIYYLARHFLKTKQPQLVEQILRRMEQGHALPAGHSFPKIISLILTGDSQEDQNQHEAAIAEYEQAHRSAKTAHEKTMSQNNLYSTLYFNLYLASAIKLFHLYRLTERFEKSQQMLETMATLSANMPSIYLDPASKQAFWLVMGEHALAKGKNDQAKVFFRRSSMGNNVPLHALTRLNELAQNEIEASSKFNGDKAGQLIAEIDKEIHLRTETFASAFPVETNEEIALLALQKLSLARRAKMMKACQEALAVMINATKETSLKPLILAYCANQPFCDGKIKRQFMRTAVPNTIEITTPIQRELALSLFATTQPKELAESAKAIKRICNSRP